MKFKTTITFDTLISLMKKNHTVILCLDDQNTLTLELDEIPEDLEDALFLIERDWDDI